MTERIVPDLRHAREFRSHEEEIAFLRSELEKHERAQEKQGTVASIESAAGDVLETYRELPPDMLVPADRRVGETEADGIVLRLNPERHDRQISELYGIMLEKGITEATKIADKLDNPHIVDDWHRFLVQYLAETHELPGIKKNKELYRALDRRLFEVTLPAPDDDAQARGFRELTQLMEQFYAGMQSISGDGYDKDTYAVEVALAHDTDQIVFYVAVPSAKVDLFEKQVLGLYPNAKVVESIDDYNIFNEEGASVGGYAESQYYDIFNLKTYDEFENDPLVVLLNVFSKLKTNGEGAALQIVIQPVGDTYIKQYGMILDRIKKGSKVKDAMSEVTEWAGVLKRVGKQLVLNDFVSQDAERELDDEAIESVKKKLESSIVKTNIRVITSGETPERAREILSDIQSAFHQFTNTKGNSLAFKEVPEKKLQEFFHSYSYRTLSEKIIIPLNLKELTTIYHFPANTDTAPQLKQAKAGTSAAPLEIPRDGILLGYNNHRGRRTPIHMQPEDRMRHLYVIGQTGVGKTGILLNMMRQDMERGEGLCFIDPHGSDVHTLMQYIPKHRVDDVIYFDPAYTPRPMGLNMLEYDTARPEQMTLIIDELMGIFNQLFDMQQQGGAMFQQYFKNSALTTMADPESGNTLLEITRVIGEKAFRDMKLSHVTNPIVRQFWKNAEATSGEQSLANFVPYISSKFDPLISNELLRPVIAQEKSAFNMREIMDQGKILLVNLSKGRLGELNANLLGLILVGKIQMAALSRAEYPTKKHRDFFLYIDEFQNVTTPSIASILSEARKYRLSLNMAHQYLEQLSDDIRTAVLGNVGSMAVFRISPEDAEALKPRFEPVFGVDDIIKQDNRSAYMSMLVGGEPVKPFNLITEDFPPGRPEIVEKIKQLSFLKYGRDRAEVESEILGKYDR